MSEDHADRSTSIDLDTIERRVVALVEKLAREVNPRRHGEVTPQSALQRDLGFDSLGLAELLMRTEKEFGVHLPDDLITRVVRPLDLAQEVADAVEPGAALAGAPRRPAETEQEEAAAAPETTDTLLAVFEWHVHNNPTRPHILLSDGFRETESITYRDLAATALAAANAMRAWGIVPGDRVGIMLPTDRTFFEAFLATLMAGAVPVPMYPPMRPSQLEEHLRRQVGILRNCEASLLLVPGEARRITALVGAQVDSLRAVMTVGELKEHGAGSPDLPPMAAPGPDDLALLQYTSGSTGDPKGVMLTHRNLMANIRAMGRAIEATPRDVFVSWLPLYHDLGLIGAWLGSLTFAVPVVVLSPLRFIVRPESWLWAIHRHQATLSAAPNFAFELCIRKIGAEALEDLDLSSLRLVANGAEPVSPTTIARFTERFAPRGFRPEAMAPVYGLAESSVGLAFPPLGRGPLVEAIDRRALTQDDRALPASTDAAHPMTFVSSGVPLPGHEIRVVDGLGRELGERRQGRLEFRGPSATTGYFRNPQKTRALFHDDWLDSGDLAYVADGNIFITGRVKDLIIKAGRNIYPEEIEHAVGALAGIRKGCVAAFATPDPRTGSERLVVVAETRLTAPEEHADLGKSVRHTVADLLDAPPDEVVIVPPHAVPKTSSGKIRRSSTRALFEEDRLGRPGRALWLQVARLGLASIGPQLRRLLTASADLAYAAWWWTVLVGHAVVVWPAVLVLPSRGLRWRLVRALARSAVRLMAIDLSVDGADRLRGKAGIVVANHSSYADSLVLAATLPGKPAFVAKQELAHQRIPGAFLRRLGTVFAERADPAFGQRAVEQYAELVRAGERLVMFPEATLQRMPGLLPFRLGAFSIAATARSAVLPVVISGTRSLLRGEQWFPRRAAVRIKVLEPVAPDGEDFSAAVRLRDRVRSLFLEHGGEPDLAEERLVFAGASPG